MILIILSILWGWSITSDGHAIQIGEILTNNQNIKIMKMNFTSPVWLQSASNVGGDEKPVTRFVFVDGNDQMRLSSKGKVIIESVQGGEVVRETYSELNGTYVTINADDGTEVVIYGAVTVINFDNNANLFASLDLSKSTALTELYCNGCTGLTSLDLSENTALTYLDCSDCTGLTSLDLSENTALATLYCYGCTGLTSLDLSNNTELIDLFCYGCTGLTSLDLSENTALATLYCNGCTGLTSLDLSENTALAALSCYGCTGLTSLDGIAVNSDVSTDIASAITNATSVDGTVTLRQGDEFNQTIIDAAMEKGWDVQYYQ